MQQQFAELVEYVERTRLTASARGFSLEALAAMRPRLRVARSPRRLTMARVFARPFEDLLYAAPAGSSAAPAKRPGQIARRAIMPCWTVVASRLAPGLLADLERGLGGAMLADLEWVPRFGPLLENHPIFPERANITLAHIVDRDHITIRTWERGAGLTKACGSAACATAVAAARLKRANRIVNMSLPGGDLTIEWRERDDHVLMTGTATFEYEGRFDPALFASVV